MINFSVIIIFLIISFLALFLKRGLINIQLGLATIIFQSFFSIKVGMTESMFSMFQSFHFLINIIVSIIGCATLLRYNKRLIAKSDLYFLFFFFIPVIFYVIKGLQLGEGLANSFGIVKEYLVLPFIFLYFSLYSKFSIKYNNKLDYNWLIVTVVFVNLLAYLTIGSAWFDINESLIRNDRSRVLISGILISALAIFIFNKWLDRTKVLHLIMCLGIVLFVFFIGQGRMLLLSIILALLTSFFIKGKVKYKVQYLLFIIAFFVTFYVYFIEGVLQASIGNINIGSGNIVHRLDTIRYYFEPIDNLIFGGYLYNKKSDNVIYYGHYYLSDIGVLKEIYLFGGLALLMLYYTVMKLIKNDVPYKDWIVYSVFVLSLSPSISVLSSAEAFSALCFVISQVKVHEKIRTR